MQALLEVMLDTDSHDGGRAVNLSSGHEPIGSNTATQATEPTNECQNYIYIYVNSTHGYHNTMTKWNLFTLGPIEDVPARVSGFT